MKEAVTKVIDMLTQEDFHGAFQKLLERYNKCIAAGGDYLFNDPRMLPKFKKNFWLTLMIRVNLRIG